LRYVQICAALHGMLEQVHSRHLFLFQPGVLLRPLLLVMVVPQVLCYAINHIFAGAAAAAVVAAADADAAAAALMMFSSTSAVQRQNRAAAYLYALLNAATVLHMTAALSTGGYGVYVTPAERDPNTSAILAGTAFLHFAVLGAVYADSPARAKLMYTVASWTAYLVCPFCIMVGTKVDDVVRYLGYAHAVAITKGYGAGKTCSMTGDGDDRYVDEFVNRVRAHVAEQYRAAGVQPPDNSPFKGLSPFLSEDLYWVDANRLWIVPFCHAFFLGVFKDFLEAIFAKGAAAQVSKCHEMFCVQLKTLRYTTTICVHTCSCISYSVNIAAFH
jgi:hypothetical protein